MTMREPGIFTVDIAKGELSGAGNRYRKTLGDLAGLGLHRSPHGSILWACFFHPAGNDSLPSCLECGKNGCEIFFHV